MEKFKTLARRFFYNIKHRWLVFDNLLPIICFSLCIFWTYGSITAMSRNWILAQTLADKQRELALITLEVETLELENDYYRSGEYAELSARAKLNKKLPGESLVYLPDSSDYAKNKHSKVSDDAYSEPSNLSQWLSFLFGI